MIYIIINYSVIPGNTVICTVILQKYIEGFGKALSRPYSNILFVVSFAQFVHLVFRVHALSLM